jgi:hypothetical protein
VDIVNKVDDGISPVIGEAGQVAHATNPIVASYHATMNQQDPVLR